MEKREAIPRSGRRSESSKATSSNSKTHRRFHTHECNFCEANFTSGFALEAHLERCHPGRAEKILRDDEYKKKYLDEEVNKRLLSRLSFMCPQCKLVIKTPDAYTEHLRELHPAYFQHLEEDKEFGGEEEKDEDEEEEREVGVEVGEEGKQIRQSPNLNFTALYYAKTALQHYNKQNMGGKRYGLVDRGYNVSTGSMDHINFKAKEKDCAGTPVETFFAQLTKNRGVTMGLRVNCCVSLGPSDKLPSLGEEAEIHGCRLCPPFIHHPRERVANLILDPQSTGHL